MSLNWVIRICATLSVAALFLSYLLIGLGILVWLPWRSSETGTPLLPPTPPGILD
jgi:hypothetical protein